MTFTSQDRTRRVLLIPCCEMDGWNAGNTLALLLMVVVIASSLLGNAILFFVIVRSPVLRTKPSNAFVLSIFFAGLMSSVTIMPLAMANYLQQGQVLQKCCGAVAFFNSAFIFSNVFLLLLVTVDRYFAIVHPMTHSAHLNLSKGLITILIAWGFAIVLAALPFTGWTSFVYDESRAQCGYLVSNHEGKEYAITILLLVYAIPFFSTMIIYSFIFHEARAVRSQIRPSYTLSTISGTSSIASGLEFQPPSQDINPNKISKATKTLALLSLHYLICYMPDAVVQATTIWDTGWPALTSTNQWTLWLSYTSFTTQPLMYGVLDRSIRKEMARLFRCRKRKQSSTSHNFYNSDFHTTPTDFAQFLKDTAG